MNIKDRIIDIVKKELGEEFFLVDVIISGYKRSNIRQTAGVKILVLVDGDHGISIDKCAGISRNLGNALEDESLMESAYLLEVSSPGLDHPLKLKRQYRKNVGRKVKVHLNNDQVKEGELLGVTKEKILLKEEMKEKGRKKIIYNEVEIPFTDIKKTNVLISFK